METKGARSEVMQHLPLQKQTSQDRLSRLSRLGRQCVRSIPLIFALLLLINIVPGFAQDEPQDEANSAATPDNEPFNAAIAAPTHISPAYDSLSTALSDPPVGVPALSWTAIP